MEALLPSRPTHLTRVLDFGEPDRPAPTLAEIEAMIVDEPTADHPTAVPTALPRRLSVLRVRLRARPF